MCASVRYRPAASSFRADHLELFAIGHHEDAMLVLVVFHVVLRINVDVSVVPLLLPIGDLALRQTEIGAVGEAALPWHGGTAQ